MKLEESLQNVCEESHTETLWKFNLIFYSISFESGDKTPRTKKCDKKIDEF